MSVVGLRQEIVAPPSRFARCCGHHGNRTVSDSRTFPRLHHSAVLPLLLSPYRLPLLPSLPISVSPCLSLSLSSSPLSPLLPLSSSPSLLGGQDAGLINVLLMHLCELRPSFHPSALAHLRCLLILFSPLLLSVCSPCFWPPPPLYSSLLSFSVLLCLVFTSFPLLSLHLSSPPLFSPPLFSPLPLLPSPLSSSPPPSQAN